MIVAKATKIVKPLSCKEKEESQLEHLRPKVLIIVTGGTICMTHEGTSDSLRPASLLHQLQELGDFSDKSLPLFDIIEWDELIDSGNVNLSHWIKIAKDIENNYHAVDGFVILHGTDTLAYTASALSFMLENLNKPVILTGSMLPMHHIQTDARKNLAVALMVSAYSQITEVCILFGSRLLRGNRARKLDCSQMDAFNSPNFPSLGRIGVDITVDDQLLLMPSKRGFRTFQHLCMNIVVITVTPGFQPSLLQHLFNSPTRPLAVILLLYGTGTLPTRDSEVLSTIQLGIKQGVEILCLTQCPAGTCSLLTYENGAVLHHLGVVEGKDTTPEAAFAKLAYLMGKGYSGDNLRDLMERDIRGEVTEKPVKVTGQAFLTSLLDQSKKNHRKNSFENNWLPPFIERGIPFDMGSNSTPPPPPTTTTTTTTECRNNTNSSHTYRSVTNSESSASNEEKGHQTESQHPSQQESQSVSVGKLGETKNDHIALINTDVHPLTNIVDHFSIEALPSRSREQQHLRRLAPELHPETHTSIHTVKDDMDKVVHKVHQEIPDLNLEVPKTL